MSNIARKTEFMFRLLLQTAMLFLLLAVSIISFFGSEHEFGVWAQIGWAVPGNGRNGICINYDPAGLGSCTEYGTKQHEYSGCVLTDPVQQVYDYSRIPEPI